MKWKKILLIIVILLVVLTGAGAIIFYPAYRFYTDSSSLQAGNDLLIEMGGGGNSGVLVTDSAVVVIDTKMGEGAGKLFDLARSKAGTKKIIVINTHYHGDHVKGNNLYKGCEIFIGSYERGFLQREVGADNMPNRFVKDSLVLDLGNEKVCMYDLGQAHTWHDMVVLLKKRQVLFTGDLIFNRVNPFLKKESGADAGKWIGALDRILAMPGITTVVPGHGPAGGREMVESMRAYFTDMTAAAADPAKEKELVTKYSDWTKLPMMTSPEATIKYIRYE